MSVQRHIYSAVAHYAAGLPACSHYHGTAAAGYANLVGYRAGAYVARYVGVGEGHPSVAGEGKIPPPDAGGGDVCGCDPEVGKPRAYDRYPDRRGDERDAAEHTADALERMLAGVVPALGEGTVDVRIDVGIAHCDVDKRHTERFKLSNEAYRLLKVGLYPVTLPHAEAVRIGKPCSVSYETIKSENEKYIFGRSRTSVRFHSSGSGGLCTGDTRTEIQLAALDVARQAASLASTRRAIARGAVE